MFKGENWPEKFNKTGCFPNLTMSKILIYWLYQSKKSNEKVHITRKNNIQTLNDALFLMAWKKVKKQNVKNNWNRQAYVFENIELNARLVRLHAVGYIPRYILRTLFSVYKKHGPALNTKSLIISQCFITHSFFNDPYVFKECLELISHSTLSITRAVVRYFICNQIDRYLDAAHSIARGTAKTLLILLK